MEINFKDPITEAILAQDENFVKKFNELIMDGKEISFSDGKKY